jgi:hypothetical protein
LNLSGLRSAYICLALLAVSCETSTEPMVDWGTCVPEAPSSTVFHGASLSVEAIPTVIDYETVASFILHAENPSRDLIDLRSEPCVIETWFRGTAEFGQRFCLGSILFLISGGTSTHTLSMGFRPAGAPNPDFSSDTLTLRGRGIEAPPSTYCFVTSIRVEGDSASIEVPFELIDS